MLRCSEFLFRLRASAMNVLRLPRSDFPVNYYSGSEIPFEEIERHLIQFTGGSIDLERHDSGIATLCINNYEKRNAISGKMMVDLHKAVTQLEQWEEGKGVILYGRHRTFSSGGDLDMARKTGTAEGGFKMASYMHEVLRRFERLPMLTVALIEGAGAIGGGAELALACDFRLMASCARGIGLVHTRMGIVPAWGGGRRLVALLGRRRALELLASARIVRPTEAVALGLADAVLPDSAADDNGHRSAEQVDSGVGEHPALLAAQAWLRERTRAAPEVLRVAKALCDNADGDAEPLDERRLFAPLWGGPPQQRGPPTAHTPYLRTAVVAPNLVLAGTFL